MSLLEFQDVCFSYANSRKKVLDGINFTVEEGEFIVLCGASGCGKTTVLRHILKSRIPVGMGQGTMWFDGQSIESMEDEKACSQIAYVGQDPENCIVTEYVWQELAFGLESLGISVEEIRKRTGEIAEYFGISPLFRRQTHCLSGGQKQLLNLASAMVMRPRLLVLDEPTSQLDPIGADHFMDTLVKLNKDFGITILLCEQRLEQVLSYADRVFIMEQGKLTICLPEQCGMYMRKMQSPVYSALPVASRTALQWREMYGHMVGNVKNAQLPLTIREGKQWLRQQLSKAKMYPTQKKTGQQSYEEQRGHKKDLQGKEWVLQGSAIAFCYEQGKDVLRDFCITLQPGIIYGLLGGNGSGKSTALKILAGIYKPHQGKIKAKGKVLYLPQNPKAVFTEITVWDELQRFLCRLGKSEEDAACETQQMLAFMELSQEAEKHPYDLSGGQAQRLAVAKALLTKPDVLLLDEPTKGLDAAFKEKLGQYLRHLAEEGLCIVIVSHDLEFCGAYTTYCGMLFDGEIISQGPVREFFAQQYFYVPAATKMAQDCFERVVTAEEIVEALKGEVMDEKK